MAESNATLQDPIAADSTFIMYILDVKVEFCIHTCSSLWTSFFMGSRVCMLCGAPMRNQHARPLDSRLTNP
jgi:hypothetical protein